jgi:hypothetical protein
MGKKSLTSIELESMYQAYKKGHMLKDIATQNGVTPRHVSRILDRENWKERKSKELLEDKRANNLVGKEELSVEIFNKNLQIAHEMLREAHAIAKTEGYNKVPVKTLTDVVDKLIRLQIFMQSGGIDKKQVEVKSHKIDWNALIKTSIKAKKENSEFNEQEFVKNAIEKLAKDK